MKMNDYWILPVTVYKRAFGERKYAYSVSKMSLIILRLWFLALKWGSGKQKKIFSSWFFLKKLGKYRMQFVLTDNKKVDQGFNFVLDWSAYSNWNWLGQKSICLKIQDSRNISLYHIYATRFLPQSSCILKFARMLASQSANTKAHILANLCDKWYKWIISKHRHVATAVSKSAPIWIFSVTRLLNEEFITGKMILWVFIWFIIVIHENTPVP